MRKHGLILAVLFLFGFGGFLVYRLMLATFPVSTVTMRQQIANVEKQLAVIEPQIHQKEKSFAGLYSKLLQTNGRFVCKTIIAGNSSRLLLADVTLRGGQHGRDGEKAVSRTYVRRDSDFDITLPSAVTAYELDLVFAHTPLQGLGKAFIQAELQTGINAIFIAAIAIIESDWGNSVLASDKNNLFGFGAYDSNVDLAQPFSSKEECVLYVAKFLREHYIDGSYYRGHSIKAINQLYASDSEWANKVFGAMCKIDRMIQERST